MNTEIYAMTPTIDIETIAQNAITAIPFSGFYNSLHEHELDIALSRVFEDDSGDRNDALFYKAQDAINWGDVYRAYAAMYAERFCEKLGIVGAAFESMQSPREYNFATDRIFCNIPMSELARIREETPANVLTEVAREMFESRSGFISFYDHDVSTWGPLESWDHNQCFALVSAYTLHASDGEELDETALMEDDICNGRIENILFTGCPDKLNRLDRVACYLRERAER